MPLSTFLAAAAHPESAATTSGPNVGFLLYVTATLLPLLSFLLLLLRGGLVHFLRPHKDAGLGQTLWNLLDGEHQGKGSAYIATVAIGGACVLGAIGFVLHATDHSHGAELARRWNGGVEWLRLDWAGDPATNEQIATLRRDHTGTAAELQAQIQAIQKSAPQEDPRGSVLLELGYKIDNLTTIMFLMVTFIATLIHIFSIGYMSEELQDTVEDHQVHTADGHLKRRGRFGRFFMYLSLFCFSMLNLIIADNLFQIFISWELVGICSYLLIGFYYERQSASNAANKAFITNRVGDAGFIIGLLIIWTYVGTFNFDEIFGRLRAPTHDHHGGEIQLAGQFVRVTEIDHDKAGPIVRVDPQGDQVLLMGHLHADRLTHYQLDTKTNPERPTPLRDKDGNLIPLAPAEMATLSVRDRPVNITDPMNRGTPNVMPYWLLVTAGLGIFLGCVGKSAQFPLSVWLPDAMEGPTPVSALIHAATMVAAGVYLVARVYPLFTPEALLVIAYTGGITLFVAATIALVVHDIKKVLAYSTVSQLGYMMLALGVGGWTAGLFHLLTHAFFKALMFLGSGAVIYGCHHEQDMRKMGGLFRKMPITALTMLMGVLAISGVPLFTGWYSKDAVLAAAAGFVRHNNEHLLLFILPLMTAGITTFYMFRMWFLTFTGEAKDQHVHEHAHEAPRLMTVPLIILAVCSVVVAWGWPVWDATASHMEHHLHHVMAPHRPEKLNAGYLSVMADFGTIYDPAHGHVEVWPQDHYHPGSDAERAKGHAAHDASGMLALFSAGLGFLFAYIVYFQRALDPADAVEQFPGVHRFLSAKWCFDELYSVLFVRPALVVAHWCRWFDSVVIDGLIDFIGRISIGFARLNGKFDFGVIDGLANLTATVAQSIGGWLRGWQTGFLRSYVLFLVMAAVGIFALLKWLVSQAAAGQ